MHSEKKQPWTDNDLFNLKKKCIHADDTKGRKRFLLIKSIKNRYDDKKKTINKKCFVQKKRQFMQGDLFKEGQRLTPVFEREQKKTNNNFYWSYCCELYARYFVPYALNSLCMQLHRSLLFRYAIRLLESCPLSFDLHH